MTNGYDLIVLSAIGLAAVAGGAYVATRPVKKNLPAANGITGALNEQLTSVAAAEGLPPADVAKKAIALFISASAVSGVLRHERRQSWPAVAGSELASNDYKEDFPHSAGGVRQPASMCQD